ncbi:hypothetical protein AB7M23_003801 [Pseudomonas sp. HLS-6 TE3448]|jgi:hypothetical protein
MPKSPAQLPTLGNHLLEHETSRFALRAPEPSHD